LKEPAHAVFERCQLLDANRPARMHLAGGDADLGAHAELAAVGELGRGVVQQDGRVDLVEEPLDRRGVLGDDRLGVVRRVGFDMVDRFTDSVDQLGRDDGVEVFGGPVGLRRFNGLRERGADFVGGADFASGLG
jgi:hypothetical protein